MPQTWGMTMDYAAGTIPRFHAGDRLRKAREVRGLGTAELAELLGVSRNTVGNYESGRVTPRRPVLIAWAMATGVPIAWLENGESPSQGGPDGGSRGGLPRLDSNQQPSGYSDAQVIELRRAA